MTTDHPESAARQEALHEILLRYVEASEAGVAPERQAFLAAHPEFADEIAEFLTSYHELNRLAAPLRAGEVPSVGESGSRLPRGQATMHASPGSPKNDDAETTGAPGAGARTPAKELGQLGDFRLLREIGRGGMGVVYEAEQISLRRRVALKVLPFAAGVDDRQLQRFRNEAEAAAHLHHSHIVPVFAVGSERGVHYYAMQFIEGQSLAALIAELAAAHGLSRQTAEPLFLPTSPEPASPDAPQTVAALSTVHSTRSRRYFQMVAGIAQQAAEALEYAHQMGVIHRDIKPANLLLDARGQVWITDFGLAQFHNHVGLTMTGELLGTLRYVSPEQAMAKRGVVDHRTDIYSLGATLYELLTLTSVFDGRDRHQILHQIAFDEPRPPRTLEATIPFELETIVLKALGKNPADRYGTAQEFADDLQRFLEDKPIQAKRPGIIERARKWMRRHPSVVGSAVVLLVCGVIGFAVSTALIAHEQGQTRAAYQRERQRAEEADQRFRLARRSADEMIQLAEEELADYPHLHNLRRRLLEAALAYYQEFIEQRRDDSDAQVELAATRDRVRKILDDLVVLQGAGQLYFLKNGAVRDDLRLAQEQLDRLGELLQSFEQQNQDAFREFHKLAAEERQQRFLKLARSNETALAAILTPRQLYRLRQIAWQCQGPLAFREPDIAAALKLQFEQKKQIRTIEANLFFDHPDGDHPRGRPKPPSWKAHEERRKTAMDQILKVLTAEQVQIWHELTGEPFIGTGPIFIPFGPMPPRGFGPPPKKPPENPPPPGGKREP